MHLNIVFWMLLIKLVENISIGSSSLQTFTLFRHFIIMRFNYHLNNTKLINKKNLILTLQPIKIRSLFKVILNGIYFYK